MGAFAPSAAALGGEHGSLRIHGTGSAFAGSGSFISQETKAGGTVSYAVQVVNTGTTTAQYLFGVEFGSMNCDPSGCPLPKFTVLAGSLDVTASATGPGYFTAPVAAGKTGALTVKVTLPSTALPSNVYFGAAILQDTAGRFIDSEQFQTIVTATKGTSANDEFVTAAGEKSVLPTPALTTVVSPANPKLGAKASFTVKLANDSAASGQIRFATTDTTGCAAQFPIDIKAGSTDVTSLALGAGYLTPVLAHGKSTTLKVTVTHASSFCALPYQDWRATASGAGQSEVVELRTNPAVV